MTEPTLALHVPWLTEWSSAHALELGVAGLASRLDHLPEHQELMVELGRALRRRRAEIEGRQIDRLGVVHPGLPVQRDPVPTPVGSSPEDRDTLLRAVALVENGVNDDAAMAALLDDLDRNAAAGLILALVTLLEAAGHRDPDAVSALLLETRAANLR
jgi:hypothetical protein